MADVSSQETSISWDWKAPGPPLSELIQALNPLGVQVREDPDFEGSDTYAFLLWGVKADPTRDAVIAVMREMEARRKRDVDAYERCTGEGRIYDVTAAVADGGAARLIWALELLRQALDLPCEWETEAAL